MAFTERDGVKLFYEEAAPAGDAAPVVLVHGWTCYHGHFALQFAYFAPSRRVVSVDLRGHGASDVTGPFAIETFAEDVAWLCGALELQRPVVIGHSMGGMIAVQVAATHPELVRAAVALDSPFAPAGTFADALAPFMAALDRPDHVAARREFLRVMFGPHDDPARAAEVTEAMLATPIEVAAEAEASIVGWDGEAALRACTVPVLTVSANPGAVTDVSRLARDCPHVMMGQTVGAGHFIQLEVPDQVNAMLERFLRIVG
jgi:pimeloyl-ACP methyl ester carboxylesterase